MVIQRIMEAADLASIELRKQIRIISLEEASQIKGINITGYNGVAWQEDSIITIGINVNKPETNEASFFHELSHIYLEYDNFPVITYNLENININNKMLIAQMPKLCGYVQSVIHHPAVYKMMKEKYLINMNEYFANCLIQKRDRFLKNSPQNKNVFEEQQDIIDGFEYSFYDGNAKEEVLKLFKQVAPDSYNSCIDITKRINQKCSIYTSDGSRKAPIMLLERVKKYGEVRKLGTLNRIWDALVIN